MTALESTLNDQIATITDSWQAGESITISVADKYARTLENGKLAWQHCYYYSVLELTSLRIMQFDRYIGHIYIHTYVQPGLTIFLTSNAGWTLSTTLGKKAAGPTGGFEFTVTAGYNGKVVDRCDACCLSCVGAIPNCWVLIQYSRFPVRSTY